MLKSKLSIGDYYDPIDSYAQQNDEEPPSFDEKFQSLQLQHQKVLIRGSQQNKIFNQLDKILKRIYKQQKLQRQDKILKRLRNLKEQSQAFNFASITNLIHLAIGKRIAIIQIRRKNKYGHYGVNKKIVQLFDSRFMKLQNIKFNDLQLQKIQRKTFVFEPFITGNGFNFESCLYKNLHFETLSKVDAKNTLHQINKLWYQSYQSLKSSRFSLIQNILMIIATIFIVVLILVSISSFFFDQTNIENDHGQQIGLNILGVMTPVIVMLLIIYGTLQIWDPITEQYEDRLISIRIHDYIAQKNKQIHQFKRKWVVQKQLLWVELKIQSKIIEDQIGFQQIITMCTEKILNGKIEISKSIFMPKGNNTNNFPI